MEGELKVLHSRSSQQVQSRSVSVFDLNVCACAAWKALVWPLSSSSLPSRRVEQAGVRVSTRVGSPELSLCWY